ncbi:MAG: multidrug effflux MFS transporter [Chthoniobacterales bacterium]|nr:multidrug effflux MFS transporter [Chthoniobacterales bacterium]
MSNVLSSSKRRGIIGLLGFLIALGPLTLDMYLPAFPAIALDLHTTAALLALTLSSDFIGIALGQLCYGPLLDRFGRKKPLYVGLFIYLIASLSCMTSRHLEQMIFWRFVVGAGGCVAGIVSFASVRDFFEPEERAKIFSIMILVMGVSPLFAPSLGNVLTLVFGWQAIFLMLAIISFFLILGARFLLPSKVLPDQDVRLSPWGILKDYQQIAATPCFYIYGLCGACSFAALFAYVSGSPQLFLNFFHVSTTTFSWIFTLIAAGFISASQLNIWLLRSFSSISILRGALFFQGGMALLFLMMFLANHPSLIVASSLLFFLMASVNITFSNSNVLAIAPFGNNTGRASALIGFSQMFLGAISSMSVGILGGRNLMAMPLVILIASFLALFFLLLGGKFLRE